MAVDYISTTPWNDPYDPWPTTESVVVSSNKISLQTFTLESFAPQRMFDPGLPYYNQPLILYRSPDGQALYYAFNFNNTGFVWLVSYFTSIFPPISWHEKTAASRSIPNKTTGSAQGWGNGSNGNAATLYIQALDQPYTEWEKRRKRLLEIV